MLWEAAGWVHGDVKPSNILVWSQRSTGTPAGGASSLPNLKDVVFLLSDLEGMQQVPPVTPSSAACEPALTGAVNRLLLSIGCFG